MSKFTYTESHFGEHNVTEHLYSICLSNYQHVVCSS